MVREREAELKWPRPICALVSEVWLWRVCPASSPLSGRHWHSVECRGSCVNCLQNHSHCRVRPWWWRMGSCSELFKRTAGMQMRESGTWISTVLTRSCMDCAVKWRTEVFLFFKMTSRCHGPSSFHGPGYVQLLGEWKNSSCDVFTVMLAFLLCHECAEYEWEIQENEIRMTYLTFSNSQSCLILIVLFLVEGQTPRHPGPLRPSKRRLGPHSAKPPQEVCGPGNSAHAGSWFSRVGDAPLREGVGIPRRANRLPHQQLGSELSRALPVLRRKALQKMISHWYQRVIPSCVSAVQAAEELDCSIFVHPWDMQTDGRMAKYWLPWLVGKEDG